MNIAVIPAATFSVFVVARLRGDVETMVTRKSSPVPTP